MKFKVTEKATRPAGNAGECFYCREAIGATHKDDCVLLTKKVKVELYIEHIETVPAHWDKDDIEFRFNESTWCATNALDELTELYGKDDGPCMCPVTTVRYIEDESEPTCEDG